MLTPISTNFRGLVTISGPTKSGKSQLAEFLIKEQKSITYIATSKERPNDAEWQKRINLHRIRRPESWTVIEYPQDICKEIKSIGEKESILVDSLGGLVEQHLSKKDNQWEQFKSEFLNILINNNYLIIIVFEEIGWGIIPSTPIGHLFRERLSNLSSLLCRYSSQKWLAFNGIAIDLEKIGNVIP